MNVKYLVGGVEMYCSSRLGGQVVEKLFAFFIVDSVPLACLLAIVLKAMRIVRLTALV
jgi:hypothetical protein